jgi:hypothetical protein
MSSLSAVKMIKILSSVPDTHAAPHISDDHKKSETQRCADQDGRGFMRDGHWGESAHAVKTSPLIKVAGLLTIGLQY